MAWNTEATRGRLLDAGTSVFAKNGLAGSRVDVIAAEAGVNKERIYQYFGNKEGLFDAVLERELSTLMDAVTLEGEGATAVIDYFGRMFDYHADHPNLMRLVGWEGLELGEPVAMTTRNAHAAIKTAALMRALPGLSEPQARELSITMLSLVAGWSILSTLDQVHAGAGEGRREARKQHVLALIDAAVRALVPEA